MSAIKKESLIFGGKLRSLPCKHCGSTTANKYIWVGKSDKNIVFFCKCEILTNQKCEYAVDFFLLLLNAIEWPGEFPVC